MAQSLPKCPANVLRKNDIRSLVRLASRDRWAFTRALAFTVALVLIARDQQDSTSVAIGEHSLDGDLSTVVDKGRLCQLQIRAERNKSVQIDEGTSFPQKRMRGTASAWKGKADDLASRIDVSRQTAIVTLQGFEIGHHSVLPHKRKECLIVLISRAANNGPGVAD
jgi:hypothetical protein